MNFLWSLFFLFLDILNAVFITLAAFYIAISVAVSFFNFPYALYSWEVKSKSEFMPTTK